MKELVFKQYKNAYRYNSDSLILSYFILQDNIKGEILDIGCGCGIIGMIIKEFFPNISLNLLDIQKENINLCNYNLKLNNIKANLFLNDFLNFKNEFKFDVLLSNPPFYRNGAFNSENTHKNISKFEKFLPFEDFIKKVNSIIKPNGALYFCYESLAFDRLCIILKKYKFSIVKTCFVYTNKNKNSRLVLIKATKSNKALNCIIPPIFMDEFVGKLNNKFKVKSIDLQ